MSSILDELKYKYPDTEGVQKANNIAEGVAAMPVGGGGSDGGVFIVGGVSLKNGEPVGVMDKTWQEIHDALQAKVVIAVIANGSDIFQAAIPRAGYDQAESTFFVTISAGVLYTFYADAENDYPRDENTPK